MNDIQSAVLERDPASSAVTSTGVPMTLLALNDIAIHEEHDPDYADQLCLDMLSSAHFTTPVLVDRTSLILLDGHHRFNVLAMHLRGLLIPAVLIDYDDDDLISVGSWRADFPVNRNVVRHAALHQKLLPKKTSRHTISFDVGLVSVPLSQLGVQR